MWTTKTKVGTETVFETMSWLNKSISLIQQWMQSNNRVQESLLVIHGWGQCTWIMALWCWCLVVEPTVVSKWEISHFPKFHSLSTRISENWTIKQQLIDSTEWLTNEWLNKNNWMIEQWMRQTNEQQLNCLVQNTWEWNLSPKWHQSKQFWFQRWFQTCLRDLKKVSKFMLMNNVNNKNKGWHWDSVWNNLLAKQMKSQPKMTPKQTILIPMVVQNDWLRWLEAMKILETKCQRQRITSSAFSDNKLHVPNHRFFPKMAWKNAHVNVWECLWKGKKKRLNQLMDCFDNCNLGFLFLFAFLKSSMPNLNLIAHKGMSILEYFWQCGISSLRVLALLIPHHFR